MSEQRRLSPERQRLLAMRLQGGAKARSLAKRPDRARAPLSFAQRQMWLLDQISPGDPAYNIPVAYRLRGEIDVRALEAAFCAIVARHEIWRTTFGVREGEGEQEIHERGEFELRLTPLEHLPPEQREAAAWALILREANTPFDLTRLPLVRVSLCRLAADEHLLLLNIHHIAGDGLSVHLVFAELAALYHGAAAALPELPIQYGDFAFWQRATLTEAAMEPHLAYWRAKLAGEHPPLPLPGDRPRPERRSSRGAMGVRELPAPLAAALRQLAAAEETTPFVLLLAAFKTLLARWTGETDLCIGSPVAQRTRAETEGLIGLFINMLALRSDLAGDPAFREILRRVRHTVLEGFEHQEMPIDRLVEKLSVRRDLSYNPLFQVVFILLPSNLQPPALPGLSFELLPLPVTTAKVDLTLMIHEGAGGLRAMAEYSTDQFDAATIDRLLESFELLLEKITAAPETALSRLPILPPSQRHRLLVEWNETRRPFPEQPVHALFTAQARRTPGAVALVSGERQMTFHELDAASDEMAAELQRHGVAPGQLLGICLERSPEMLIAVLAVLKTGAAYVPLDPAFPAERLALMVEDASIPLLVTQALLVPSLPPHRAEVFCVDTPAACGAPAAPREPAASMEDRAYVLFTSGSTGRPKGVEITHRNLTNFLCSMQREPGLRREEVLLAVTTLSFDIAGLELFLPLITGARLVLASMETATDGNALARAIERHGVTVMQATPVTWRLLLAAGWPGRRGFRALIGGEACPLDLARQLLGRCDELWNLYGPTETTIWSTLEKLSPEAERITIGRPIANTEIYLVDERLEPVPIGVPGELLIGGAGVARGYLQRPELTAERFIPHPFQEGGAARVYRTGDLARYLPDGRIECLGRIDRQLKLRGLRLEPGEIEAALREHPAVRDAVVVVTAAGTEKARLIAYVVAAAELPPDHEWRAFLRRKLPDSMIPAALVPLERIPLTANGKVDRRALPDPEPASPAAHRPFVAPRNELESQIAAVWAEVLKLDRVSVEDDFFELGGHSLAAMQVLARLPPGGGGKLKLRQLFDQPTVAGLARLLLSPSPDLGPPSPDSAPIPPADRSRGLPLSFAQEQLWMVSYFEPKSAAYNFSAAWLLTGALDVALLERSLNEIARRHEILRTNVVLGQSGHPVQVIRPFAPRDLPIIPVAEEELARRTAEEIGRGFDLAGEPPWRATLLRVAPGRHLLCLSFHHTIWDAWSMDLFVRELEAIHAAFRDGKPLPLPELPIQYADFAAWQRATLTEAALEPHLAWWRRQLEGLPDPLVLPGDRPRPARRSGRGAMAVRELPVSLAEGLPRLAAAEKTTPFVLLLAAVKALLARWTGETDLCVGSPVARRPRVETESMIGLFINLLALRSDLSGDPAFREVLRRVRTTVLEGFEHQETPFDRLVARLSPKRQLSYNPLFQVAFLHLPAGPRVPILHGLAVEPVPLAAATAKFDLTLVIEERPGGLRAMAEYSTDQFDPPTIDRLLASLERLLTKIVAAPETALSALPAP